MFYDLETTGLNKAFDQILHFAAIRTDIHLNELKRYELKIKLNPDVIPSPGALITHQIGIADAQQGEQEYQAIQQIHQWMNEPGTLSLGYNTLNFDDEFLRFSFYRNLLPPYTHQYANQCSRLDIFPMAVMFYLFKKPILEWPERNGKISLKLEDINAANQLAPGRSHDAMVDVEITLALAKRFSQDQEMWQYLQGYFNKKSDTDRIKQTGNQEALLIDSSFGFEKQYQSPVCSLGFHQHYKNQSLWLCLDTPDLTKSTAQDFIHYTRVKNKKLGEPGFIVPYRERFTKQLAHERLERVVHNQQWIHQNPDVLKTIIDHYAHYTFPIYPETDTQARLYANGFWTPEEETICRLFHQASPKEKAKLTEKIQQPILATLALRILGRHFPDVMTAKQKEQFLCYLDEVDHKETILDYKGEKRLTPQAAQQIIATLHEKNALSSHQILLLDELKNYLQKR